MRRQVTAVLDQGLASGSLFLASLLVARWLPPAEYGIFAAVQSVLALAWVVQTVALTEPLLLYGPGRLREGFAGYVRLASRANLLLVAVVAVVAAAAWAALPGGSLPARFARGLVLVVPAGLASLFWRRVAYARLHPAAAARGSAAQALVTVAALAGLAWSGPTVDRAFAVLGIGLLAGAAATWVSVRPRPGHGDGGPGVGEVVRLHVHYAKYGWAASLLAWVPLNLLFLVLPATSGWTAGAPVKAALNLTTPLLQAHAAVGAILLPRLAALGTGESAARELRATLAWVWATSLAAWAAVILLGPWAMGWLYGGQYDGERLLVALVGALVLTEGTNYIFGSTLRARDQMRLLLAGYALGAATAVGGLLLGAGDGPTGAAALMVAASAGATVGLGAAVLRSRAAAGHRTGAGVPP